MEKTYENLLKNLDKSKEEQFNDKINHQRVFDEYSFKGKPKQNLRIREALLKVAGGVCMNGKKDGYENWYTKKFIKNIMVSPQLIMQSKYSKPPQKTYFFIDTNCKNCGGEHCGWVNYSEFSVMLIETAKNTENIEVWSGSKCRPERNEKIGKQIFPKRKKFHENLELWIKKVRPEKGSTFVFWGECYNISLESVPLKKAVRGYKCLWLDSLQTNDHFFEKWLKKNDHNEPSILKEAGFTVVKNCFSTEGFVKGILTTT